MGKLRSLECPMGLEGLAGPAAEKVRLGNTCMQATIKLCKAAMRAGVPWIVEHPKSSYMWKTPLFMKILRDRR
eukprot:7477331-Lingulodinium_polyedra.AAC.1